MDECWHPLSEIRKLNRPQCPSIGYNKVRITKTPNGWNFVGILLPFQYSNVTPRQPWWQVLAEDVKRVGVLDRWRGRGERSAISCYPLSGLNVGAIFIPLLIVPHLVLVRNICRKGFRQVSIIHPLSAQATTTFRGSSCWFWCDRCGRTVHGEVRVGEDRHRRSCSELAAAALLANGNVCHNRSVWNLPQVRNNTLSLSIYDDSFEIP